MSKDNNEVILPGGITGLMKNVQGRDGSEETKPTERKSEAPIYLPERRSAGRPKVHVRPLERTSITLDPEVMGKLRSLALNTGRQLNSIIEESLESYFESYEKKNGEIVIPEIYRKT